MAKDINTLRTESQTVQNATQIGENTAQRVGGVLVDIVDKLQPIAESIATVEISDLDSLPFPYYGSPAVYTVVNGAYPVGGLVMFGDTFGPLGNEESHAPYHQLTQILITNEMPPFTGSAHIDGNAYMYIRMYRSAGAANWPSYDDTPENSWSGWRIMDGAYNIKTNVAPSADKLTLNFGNRSVLEAHTSLLKYINILGWELPSATETEAGVMSAEDKKSLADLMKDVYPLEISLSVLPDIAEYAQAQDVTVSWAVKRKGQDVPVDDIEQFVVLCDGGTLTSKKENPGTYTVNTDMDANHTYMVRATAYGITKSAYMTLTVVKPMYFGFNAASSAGSLTITDLTKQAVKASPAGTYTLANGADGEYMWLCVPEDMSISKVTLNGFDVPMEAAQALATSYGNYNCYRSSNALVKGSYTIQIEGKGIAVQPSQPGESGSTVIVQVDELSEDNLLDIINKNNNLE